MRNDFRKTLDLSFSLAKAKFKLRNEGSYFGIFWYLLEPFAAFIILFALGKALSQHNIPYYPVYLLLGLIIFNFFTAVTNFSINSIVQNASLIKSVKIAKEPFVLSGLFQFVFSHLFEIVIVAGMMMYFDLPLLRLLAYFLIFSIFALFTLGISLILSVVGVYIRDLSNVWVIACRLLWFATPIFYSAGNESTLSAINHLNPIYVFISAARDIILIGALPSFAHLIAMVAISFSAFAIGAFFFQQKEDVLVESL